MHRNLFCSTAAALLMACSPALDDTATATSGALPFDVTKIAQFDEPWAMTFLPEFNRALITQKAGKLMLWEADGPVVEVQGVPAIAYGGQGGLGDVILDPDFATNGLIYLSFAETGKGGKGAAVARAKLDLAGSKPQLTDLQTIWRQVPKVGGGGHFGHRLAFSPDGKYLFISSGERQQFDPAQDMNSNLGKVVRLNRDGSTPADNPFFEPGNPVRAQIWSLGHRNPLGLAFDGDGRLWNTEMGPEGGDELNLVLRGANYGYPKASNGSHYGGKDIPDHKAGDGFSAPKAWWNPSISPGSLMIYRGDMFPKWKGDAFIGALGGSALIRVDLEGETAKKAEQWDLGTRIREVESSADGAIWLLEDGPDGRLLKLTPKQ